MQILNMSYRRICRPGNLPFQQEPSGIPADGADGKGRSDRFNHHKVHFRFARNTAVLLETVRELRLIGIAVYFEEQNINTLSGDGEVMLTVLASFAEEESRSVSENRKWSIRKKFERGEYMINTERFMGYDKDEFGELVINSKEAIAVRFFADMYLLGVGSSRLGQLADFFGIPSVTGGKWTGGSIYGNVQK